MPIWADRQSHAKRVIETVLCTSNGHHCKKPDEISKIKPAAGLRMPKIPNCLAFCLRDEFIRKKENPTYYFDTPGIHECWVSELLCLVLATSLEWKAGD